MSSVCLLCVLGVVGMVLMASEAEMAYRPTGISLQSAPFYKPDPSGMFACLDGSKKIPFNQINDDYCDCADSSDEPGTSACSEGTFVCANHGYIPVTILSSRVNDHVCDCCDGSDEYNSGKSCPNTCLKEREKQLDKFRAHNDGYQKRQQYIKEAKKALEEKKKKLSELTAEFDAENAKLEDLRVAKEEAEKPEKDAKDKYDQMVKEIKSKRSNELMMIKSAEAFLQIDSNQDQSVSLDELLACASIDGGSDQCGMTEEEVKELFPVDQESVDLEGFRELIWTGKLDKVFKSESEKQREELKSQDIEEEEHRDEFDEESENAGVDYDDEDSDRDDNGENSGRSVGDANDEDVPPMDEDTQRLIDVANEARQKFKEQERVTKDVEKEKSDMEKDLSLDLGGESEFFNLVKQCFDFQQKDYTYTFCPFDRGAQKSKNGGSEISLGRWGEWSGPPDNKYSQMKLTKGQRCWNGPDRSLTVNFECGEENKVLSTSEPSMCEYVMQFSTPALCTTYFDFDSEKKVHEDL